MTNPLPVLMSVSRLSIDCFVPKRSNSSRKSPITRMKTVASDGDVARSANELSGRSHRQTMSETNCFRGMVTTIFRL